MRNPAVRLTLFATIALTLSACDRTRSAGPAERVGYLRELVRARMIAGDTTPIDACSMDRFMEGVSQWQDSLLTAERVMIAGTLPCASTNDSVRTVPGRFVVTSWYRNWSGEYVIRGATSAFDQGYRFSDGVFVGHENLGNERRYSVGIAAPRSPVAQQPDSARADSIIRDSIRLADARADTIVDSLAARSGRRPGRRRRRTMTARISMADSSHADRVPAIPVPRH